MCAIRLSIFFHTSVSSVRCDKGGMFSNILPPRTEDGEGNNFHHCTDARGGQMSSSRLWVSDNSFATIERQALN